MSDEDPGVIPLPRLVGEGDHLVAEAIFAIPDKTCATSPYFTVALQPGATPAGHIAPAEFVLYEGMILPP